jgi:hypothetical protein
LYPSGFHLSPKLFIHRDTNKFPFAKYFCLLVYIVRKKILPKMCGFMENKIPF